MHTILMLGAGQEQCIAIKEAKSLGYRVVACDGNPAAPGLSMADVGIVCDNLRDVNFLTNLGKRENISGIFCHAVEIPEVVAQVAQRLNLPGITPEVAHRCTNKYERIAALRNANIPVPIFASAANYIELLSLANEMGYPLVLKPIDNAGSRGVQLITDVSKLKHAYEEAMTHSNNNMVLIEKVLYGPQISTESVVWRGEVHTFAFADRNYEREDFYAPYFIENGINFPSRLPAIDQMAVLDMVNRTIKALGINFGAAKGDVIIHNGLPHIIEMACRTSGGWFSAGSIPAATGVNPLKPLLQMAMAEEPDLKLLIPKKQLGCAQRYWIPQQAGIFKNVSGFEKVTKLPGVVMFNHFFPVTGTKLEKARHHAQRYAQVICTGETREQAALRAEAAIAAINVEFEFQ
jgi:biotin carboxylase